MPASLLVFPRLFCVCLWAVGLAVSVAPAVADVSLPAIFSDHAVLQKSAHVPVWGRAEPGEKVTVTLGQAKAVATAGDGNRWEAVLDLSRSAPGPFNMVVQGTNTLTVSDVVVGEVWLASGQSNMEWPLVNTIDAGKEVAASANPLLRLFSVTKAEAAVPVKGYQGKWVVAGPQTVAGFSAVGYYFGKFLQQGLKAPVGIVLSAWGGTPSETWTSKEALASDPEISAGAEKAEADLRTYSRRLREYLMGISDWQDTNQRKDRPFDGVPSGEDWQAASVPGKLGGAGAIWLRRTLQIPAEQAGRPLTITLGEGTSGIEQVFWNGKPVGSTSLEQAAKTRGNRVHTVPASQVTAGEAVVAIRLFHPFSDIATTANITVGNPPLAGDWKKKTEFELPPLSPDAKASIPASPGLEPWAWQAPAHLFNAMISPLIPYAIQGAIWYQGENNVPRAFQYRKAFPLLISDWRSKWGQGDFPFYFCQLANMNGKQSAPGDSNWAELREAQSRTLSLPNTGQAVLIDLGDANNIHPRNKSDVGSRLAFLALARTYGKSVPFSGPVYASMKIEGKNIRLTFDKTDGGLVAKPLPATYSLSTATNETAPLVPNSPKSKLEGFAICGADQQWAWADARIDGNQVVVWSDQVPAPVAVRYAWSNNPTCNLYNGACLPASPFRTDDFPITSQSARY